jgi:integrase
LVLLCPAHLGLIVFLYQEVLGIELPRLDALRARRPRRLPAVLSPEEVRQLLEAVRGGEGVFRLMAGLLYGAGLRREECCRLRVHDLDLRRDQIVGHSISVQFKHRNGFVRSQPIEDRLLVIGVAEVLNLRGHARILPANAKFSSGAGGRTFAPR